MRNENNVELGSNFDVPVVYYREFISVIRGRNAKNAALEGQIIRTKNLEEIAAK